MKPPAGTDAAVWQSILDAEPALAALLSTVRDPRYRYFEVRGYRYGWTTERMGDGKFAAFVYRPVGRGARSGKAQTLKLAKDVRFRRRKDAKARALKWYRAASFEAVTP